MTWLLCWLRQLLTRGQARRIAVRRPPWRLATVEMMVVSAAGVSMVTVTALVSPRGRVQPFTDRVPLWRAERSLN